MTRGNTTHTNGSFEIAERFKAAIDVDDTIAVTQLIAEGLDVNAQDEEGMTALHHAAAHGTFSCVAVLASSGKCDYLLKDKYGRTASELTDKRGRDSSVGRLLSKKEARQARSQIPAIPGALEIAEKFKAAIYRGNGKAIADMITEGLDVNARDAEGMTALHHVAVVSARACLRVLVDSGKCDYLVEDYEGRTAAVLAFDLSVDRAVANLLAKKEAMARYLLTQRPSPSINPAP